MEDRCVCCGEIIPEGQQVCRKCLQGGRNVNGEGYKDPTADTAVHRASKMPKHIWRVYKMLNAAASVSGLEITGLLDKETGNEYKR